MPLAIDHLLFAGEDLEEVVNAVFMESGVRATLGGRHHGQGTHNALIGLGPGRYLELMAQDPDGDDAGAGAFRRSIAYLRAPALHTWCARTDDIDGLAARVGAAGVRPTRTQGGRTRPDGTRLRWTLVGTTGHAYGGLMPFFIDWQDSAHPSSGLGNDLRLTRLTLSHPDARGLERLLDALGGPVPDVAFETAPAPRVHAAFEGPVGAFALSGAGGAMRFA